MGYFLIFIFVIMILTLNGLLIWWIWSKVYTNIKRQDSVFDIEKETHEQIKKRMKEENKE